jgi:hypothetical protein
VTLPGKGYRFAVPVRTVTQPGEVLVAHARARTQIVIEESELETDQALKALPERALPPRMHPRRDSGTNLPSTSETIMHQNDSDWPRELSLQNAESRGLSGTVCFRGSRLEGAVGRRNSARRSVLDLYGFRAIGPRYARDAPVQSDAQQQSHHEHNEDKQKLPRPASGIFKPKFSNMA